jgi:type VI secretion system secreted protein VgrG
MKVKLKASEKDVKEKVLQNLFIEATKDMGIKVGQSYHLNAKSIKSISFSDILYEGDGGISLKCGGNVLTVDGSGIHFKTPNFDDNSTDSGVAAKEVKEEGEVVNVRLDDDKNLDIHTLDDEVVYVRADSSLDDGTSVKVILNILGSNEKILASKEIASSVKANKIIEKFDLEALCKDNNINKLDIEDVEGEILWHNA